MTDIPENTPALWQASFPFPESDSHKYSRGIALIRGGATLTGAARLAARAAQRMGAGLVTVAAPATALPVYAESLESVIVRPCDALREWQTLVNDAKHPAILIGPGLGLGVARTQEVVAVLDSKRSCVLDADALTNFADQPETLLEKLYPECVLTPHEGEFARLFGGGEGDKTARAVQAAERAGCIVLLKGAETIIAAPDGHVAINRNAPPWLATGGSGDVLAGMIVGLIAQKMSPFLSACAAAWMHGKIASDHGPGLIAEDIVAGIPKALLSLFKNRAH
jgi:hydroxyethylthiazole kinase-like uncharacterized protein yjeF